MPGLDPARRNEHHAALARRFEVPLLVAALLVVPAIVLEESSVGHGWKTFAGVLNWTVWGAFFAELAVMTATAPGRLRWLRSHPLEVAIVVLTPPFLPASLQSARLLRLLRVLRLALLAPLARRVFSLAGLRLASFFALLTALAGGAAFAAVEKGYSTWRGVYWAITTMTTVGYGDLAPKTDAGRVISIAVMLVGIGFVAILTGAIAQHFLAAQAAGLEQSAAEVSASEADIVAHVRTLAAQVRELERLVERQLGQGR